MEILYDIPALRQALAGDERVAFVPTMGNLHEGHFTLTRAARKHADRVVASIFVNPLQFGPSEDFDRYPRTLEADSEGLRKAGVDLLFAPSADELYPEPQSCFVEPSGLQNLLEGEHRPGHFRGVATVVLKLFNCVRPHAALFGKKDYQQLMVIRAMTRQLCLPIEIIGVDTVRAPDGLALSSRNGYLSPHERAKAPFLAETLQTLRLAIRKDGIVRRESLEREAAKTLDARGWKTDYVAVRRQADLLPPESEQDAMVILAASRLGETRLIDNLEI